MEQPTLEVNLFETLKVLHTVANPETIRELVAAWAFEDADTASGVATRLEEMDCAGCYSPAPIYYADMAREIVEHWPEIDAALSDYRDAIGEPWTPKPDPNFQTHLWFAYEWTARSLADAIREELDSTW